VLGDQATCLLKQGRVRTLRAACCPVWASCTSHTVEKCPHPSFVRTVYLAPLYCSPIFTGWYPPAVRQPYHFHIWNVGKKRRSQVVRAALEQTFRVSIRAFIAAV
jgi:hypothetical protein